MTYKPGEWNAVCAQCGQKFKSGELRMNWKRQYVCAKDFEVRHPQEGNPLPNTPDTPHTVQLRGERLQAAFCTPNGRTAMPGFALPGCAIPGFTDPLFDPEVVIIQ